MKTLDRLNRRRLFRGARNLARTAVGTHLIADFSGCQNPALNDAQKLETILTAAAERCGATILHTKFHRFSPQGITGYLLLAESHISIHTWPELQYAAVDIFTCGNMRAEEALEYLKHELGAVEVSTIRAQRGAAFAGEGSSEMPR